MSELLPIAWIEHHKGGDNLVWEKTNNPCTPLYRSAPPAGDAGYVTVPRVLLMDMLRRLDWIEIRARYALEGKEWSRDIRETPRDSVRELVRENAKLRAQSAPQWIPCSERLPEPETLVDVWVSSYYQGKGGHDQAMLKDGKWKNFRYSQSLEVTHWMPLPEPPSPATRESGGMVEAESTKTP